MPTCIVTGQRVDADKARYVAFGDGGYYVSNRVTLTPELRGDIETRLTEASKPSKRNAPTKAEASEDVTDDDND